MDLFKPTEGDSDVETVKQGCVRRRTRTVAVLPPWAMGPTDVLDDDLNKLAPASWKPNFRQRLFARARIARPDLNGADLSRELNIPEGTIGSWRKGVRFKAWMDRVLEHYGVAARVPESWRSIAEKACKGDRQCAHMLFLRYDRQYRAAVNKQPLEQEPETPSVEALAEQLMKSQGIDEQPPVPAEQKTDPPGGEG